MNNDPTPPASKVVNDASAIADARARLEEAAEWARHVLRHKSCFTLTEMKAARDVYDRALAEFNEANR